MTDRDLVHEALRRYIDRTFGYADPSRKCDIINDVRVENYVEGPLGAVIIEYSTVGGNESRIKGDANYMLRVVLAGDH